MSSSGRIGNAVRAAVTKHFSWRFRERWYSFVECENPANGTFNTRLHLKSGDDLRRMVTFHPEEIFRESLEANATLRFQHLANADTNADADISLEEVAQIPAPVVELTKEDARDAGVLDGGYIVDDMSKFPGWARFIGQRLLQRAFYMDGNVCRDDVSRSKAFEAESPYEL